MTGRRMQLGKPLLESLPELAGQSAVTTLDRVYRSGEAETQREMAAQLVRESVRTECWLDLTWQPMRDARGTVTGVLICSVEVTDHVLSRRHAGEARSAADAASRFTKAITDNASVGLVMLDARQHCTFLNPAAEQIFGYSFAEVQARNCPLHEIVHHTHPDGRPYPIAECPVDRALPQRLREQGEEVFVRPDGAFYPVAFTASPLLADGVPVGTVLEVEDTTARARLEADVRESEERFRSLADNVSQLVWMADADGRISWYNRRWYEYTGTTLEDMQGRGWEHVHHPEHVERVRAFVREAWGRGEPFELTFPLRSREGTWRWFLTRAVPYRDAAGALVRWIGTNTDVTAEKETQVALEAALRSRDEFISIASHELRTPVTSLKLQSQTLLRSMRRVGAQPPTADRLQTFVGQVDRQVARIARLIDDMFDISRIQTGRLQLRPEPFDLADAVRDVAERMNPLFIAAGAPPPALRAPDPAVGAWDRARLEQVLTNLLTNALRYGNGGPTEVRLERRGASVQITVRDEGRGIALADQARIFDRFERAISKSEASGLGLGLFITRQIVEAHGGTISVESTFGAGATFTVQLPLTPPSSPHETSSAA